MSQYASDFLSVSSNGPISLTSALRIESGIIAVPVVMCRLIRDIPIQSGEILERGMRAIGRMNSEAMKGPFPWSEETREEHTRGLIRVVDLVAGTVSPQFEFVRDAPDEVFDDELREAVELIFGVRTQVFGIRFEFGNLVGAHLKEAIRDYEAIYSNRIQGLTSNPYSE